MTLRIGIHTGQQDCTYDELRRLWRLADDAGFYWISVWDHHYESPPVDGTHPAFETVSIHSALALETKRARVGCLVYSMGYRNPALVAKAVTTIDHLSNGRAEVGIGAGWHEPEYRAFGYDFPRPGVREDMLEEGAQIIRSMLRQERTTFEGHHFTVRDATNFPRPVQPELRLWVGGGGEKRTIPIAARYADAWNVAYVPPGRFADKMGVLDAACERERRDPVTIGRAINVGFYMGVDEADAARKRERLPWPAGDPRIGGLLLGTPQATVERIGEYARAGAEQLNIAVRAPFDWDALQSFIEEVMPAFA